MTKLYEERLSACHLTAFLSLLRCIAVHLVEDPMATISLCGNGPSQCILEGATCGKHSIQIHTVQIWPEASHMNLHVLRVLGATATQDRTLPVYALRT